MKLTVGNPEMGLNTNVLDITVPEQLKKNVSTGWAEVDNLFSGDGVMPSTVGLVTGVPGSGKTTFCVQLADVITGTSKEGDPYKGGLSIYNGLEESFYQVRRVTERLNIRNGFIAACETDVDDLIEHCEKVRALPENKDKQLFLFIDSLPCLEKKREEGKRGRDKGPENQQIEIVQDLTDWAKKTYAIVLILGHVNKKGEFAGKQTLKHIVDVHLHLDMDRDTRSSTYGHRIAIMEKNRTGTSGLYYAFQVGRFGFLFVPNKEGAEP